MAKAFVRIDNVLNRQSYAQLEFRLSVGYYGSDVPDNEVQGPHVVDSGALANTQNALQIQTSITTAVIAHALTLGLTVANGDVLMTSLVII